MIIGIEPGLFFATNVSNNNLLSFYDKRLLTKDVFLIIIIAIGS